MLEFEILAQGCYSPELLHIDYDPTLRMPITPAIQAWMDSTWQRQLVRAKQLGTRLFDAPLYRYVDALAQPDGTFHLTLGDTSYKEYVTTRIPDFARERARHELGNALAVCSVVETSDHFILLDKREGVDVYVGRYHVIGGFFERHRDETATWPDPFAAMRREIREETGIQASDIRDQYCLGLVYDLTTPHPELCFLTRLSISLDEVLHQRTPEEDEIKHLYPLLVSPESLRAFVLTHHGNISATGEPNLLLYGKWSFGQIWLTEILNHF